MKQQDFSSLTLAAIQVALKAGDILRKGFGTVYEIKAKPGRQNFVTEYDKASEECIISFIKEHFPKHNILAEESGLHQGEENAILWVIDPLDGTTNFAHHLPIFTISIAAYWGDREICGVIFQPLTHELFIAEKSRGAYLNGSRLFVSQTDRLDECFVVTGLSYETSSVPISFEQILQLNQKGAAIRHLGSAALSLAYVAAGKADAFWMHNLYSWDLAAGKLLIEEAGGCFTSYKSPEHPFLNIHSNILATNQVIHPLLADYLNPSF